MSENENNRVRFLGTNDLAFSHQLIAAEKILKSSKNDRLNNVNDIIEFYQVKLLIDSGFYLKNWSDSDIFAYKEKVKKLWEDVKNFITSLNDNNISKVLNELNFFYIDPLFELISKLNIFKGISENVLGHILNENPHYIWNVLKNKKLVLHYDNCLRSFMLKNSNTAEIILSIYEVKDEFTNVKLFLPKSLTDEDKNLILENYINSECSSFNYLPLIENSRIQDGLKVSDKIRLKARRKIESENKAFFETNNNSIKYGVSIIFSDKLKNIKESKLDGLHTEYSYNINYIENNKSLYNLFLNFTELFEYVDSQKRINLVSKPIQMGIIESIMGVNSKNFYSKGFSFEISKMTSEAQLYTYLNFLSSLGVKIEDIIKNVYNEKLPEIYGYNNAVIFMPSPYVSSLEKIRTIAPEVESILKQFKNYVEDGEIDLELLQYSLPLTVESIPSLNNKKYLYLNYEHENIKIIQDLIFSNQTLLSYVDPFKENKYINLYELLRNEEIVKYNNYEQFQKIKIDYLIEQGYLYVDSVGLLRFTNLLKIYILKDLYENEVISFHHYPKKIQDEALFMLENNEVFYEDSLFSTPEKDYLDFYLNKKKFTNGYDLRNKYLHGAQSSVNDIDEHDNSYLVYLKLLILILFKIEDDLNIKCFNEKSIAEVNSKKGLTLP